MFLKSLDLYGFKSFADKTHIDFADGITSLLGQNGTGKSNIVDAIKWVLGEQSMKTIRAGKKEDVIFNGTDTRKPMNFAEVTLVIDNSEHRLPTDLPEIEIKRRVFRSGEPECYINKQRCLLRNITELFYDTGVGKSAYSILEQGKIDQILSTKPEDRRYIFEEAAGISRYKKECTEAQNKLEHTQENISDIEIQAREVKRICDRTKSQAEKALRARELDNEIFDLDVQYHLGQLRTYTLMNQERARLKTEAEIMIAKTKEQLDAFTDDINQEQEALKARNEELHALEISITKDNGEIGIIDQKISSAGDRLQDYAISERASREKADSTKSSLDIEKASKESYEDTVQENIERLDEARKQLEALRSMKEETAAKIGAAEGEIASLEEENGRLDEELQQLSEALKAVIEDLISEVDEKTGTEYSAERRSNAEEALLRKGSELKKLADDKIAYIASLKQDVPISKDITAKDFTKLSSGIDELISLFAAYKASIPPVIDTLLSPEGLIGRKREVEGREDGVRRQIAMNRAAISSGQESLRMMRADLESLSETIDAASGHCYQLEASVETSKEILANMEKAIKEKEDSFYEALSAAERARNGMEETSEAIRELESSKQRMKEEVERKKAYHADLTIKVGEMNSAIMRKRQEKEDLVNRLSSAQKQASEQAIYLSNSDQLTNTVLQNFFNKHGRNLGEFMEEFKDRDIPSETETLKLLNAKQKEREACGSINYMAEDEYKESLEQYRFYAKHLEDLEKARADLQQVLDEITAKSVDLFTRTYRQISENFQAMFKRLFGGGRAEITLEDPENVLTSGIQILAQPPGKKPQYLSLLSGGERSMTAVALLFATYQVKPSPFCILDELDAALDDRNIGYFLSVLTEFSKTSQFIIITHNKHTVTGSEQLLGVTQEEAGVSTTVSWKLGKIAGEPTILNERNEVVKVGD